MRCVCLAVLLLLAAPAVSEADLVSCVQSCLSGGSDTTPATPSTPSTPPAPTTKVFPDTITFDNTSDQGTGAYYGTACVLFPTAWEGKIKTVTVNGETAAKGVSYKGRPVFRLLKTGDQYSRPLQFLVTATDGTQYIARTSSESSGSGGGGSVTGTTGKSVAILWKPVADSGGMLVVLLPPKMGKPAVAVTDMAGTVIESGVFKYFSNPNRATYRFTRPGRSFPSPCLLRVGDTLYLVRDAAKRNEALPVYTP